MAPANTPTDASTGTRADAQPRAAPAADTATRYKTVLLFGAPGAGKGTQGKVLGTIPGFYHFACGDVFRNIDINSELGKIFYEYSSKGQLVPDDVTVKMWAENIRARATIGTYKPRADLLVLDGIPRTLEQANLMDHHIEVLKVVHLSCSDENAMFERLRRRALKENRYDDADEKVIRKRWEVYEQETRPVLSYYPPEAIVEVDSLGSPARVLRDILDVVVPIQDALFATFEG
jgi:adenylate kinase